MDIAYLFALASATAFAAASLIFAEVSRRVTPIWMNAIKAVGAWILFGASVVAFGTWAELPTPVLAALLISGISGLAIGDIFLLTAYARMGAARTMILYGFQPLFIGVGAHFLFGQDISWYRGLAVVFFMACLFTFSLEKFRSEGHWELKGLLAALIGVMFDNAGVLLTRWAFEQAGGMDSFQANFWRCTGAVAFFFVLGLFIRIDWVGGWRSLSPRGRKYAVFSVFLGTYLSLFLYLTAIKIGHLASISGLAVAGPIISATMECIYYRRRPTKYLLTALIFFIVGFAILSLT